LLLFVAQLLTPRLYLADFFFEDFNQTTGIILNGDAATTSCMDWVQGSNSRTNLVYPQHYPGQVNHTGRHGRADEREFELRKIQREGFDHTYNDTVQTNNMKDMDEIARNKARFGHRPDAKDSRDAHCSQRIRLTPSQGFKTGSMWYTNKVPVVNGFQSQFSFKITDHSRTCTKVKDKDFGTIHHESCSVHGGDGFAFVIHGDPAGTSAMGRDGSGLGYEGIKNSLAVEFDTWYNSDTNEPLIDHVSIFSAGSWAEKLQTGNSAVRESARLGVPKAYPLADGDIHMVKIQYFDQIQHGDYKYVDYMSASSALLPFIMDNNEDRRLGMLVIWMDKGIEDDVPLMAIPINLAMTLKLEQGEAFVGFTAATGSFWEKHDLLGWHFCEKEMCETEQHQRAAAIMEFDYHLYSRSYLTGHYGHSEASTVHQTYRKPFDKTRTNGHPNQHSAEGHTTQYDEYNMNDVRAQEHDEVGSVHHTIPDTSAWGPPRRHFSKGSNPDFHKHSGLGPSEYQKVPGTATSLDNFAEL
jgi:hypothetical protein